MYLVTIITMNILIRITSGQSGSSCNTPLGETGRCVSLQQCPALLKIINDAPRPLPERVKNYIQQSVCGNPSDRIVCCRLQDIASTTPPPVRPSSTNSIQTHRNLNLLELRNCGPVSADRIAFGNATVLYEFPWMALLGYEDNDSLSPEWNCGGSVISRRYVLTAAHCISGLKRGRRLTTVRLGEYDISSNIDCMRIGNEEQCTPAVQDISVQRAISHPQFNNPLRAHDIGLIRLARDADFSQFAVQAICLPLSAQLMNQRLTHYIVTGWGTTESQRSSDKLLKARVPFVDTERCQNLFRSVTLSAGQLCAGGENRTDSCGGDSGGPLQFPASYGTLGAKYVQFGIVSFGHNSCGQTSNPGVYTRVSHYLPWILDNLEP